MRPVEWRREKEGRVSEVWRSTTGGTLVIPESAVHAIKAQASRDLAAKVLPVLEHAHRVGADYTCARCAAGGDLIRDLRALTGEPLEAGVEE